MQRGGRETCAGGYAGVGVGLDAVEIALEEDETGHDDDHDRDDGDDDAGSDHDADLRTADPETSGPCSCEDGVVSTQPPPRLPVRRETDDPRLAELFARGMRRPDGEVLNIFGTLAHHPDMFRRWLVFAAHVLSKNTLPARDRELLILRTGWNCKSRYEWGQHVLIARDCGLSDAEIERIKEGPAAADWAASDRSLLVAADELHATSSMSDPTWEALSAVYTAEQMLDIVATVGNYHLVAMFLNTTRVELDPGVPDVDIP